MNNVFKIIIIIILLLLLLLLLLYYNNNIKEKKQNKGKEERASDREKERERGVRGEIFFKFLFFLFISQIYENRTMCFHRG